MGCGGALCRVEASCSTWALLALFVNWWSCAMSCAFLESRWACGFQMRERGSYEPIDLL